MLHINDLTYRIEGAPDLGGCHRRHPDGPQGRPRRPQRRRQDDAAEAHLRRARARRRAPSRCRATPASATSRRRRRAATRACIDWVLAADTERASAARRGRDRRTTPHRIAEHPRAARRHRRAFGARARRAASSPASASTRKRSSAPAGEFSGGWRMRVALARRAVPRARDPAARRADQLPRSRRRALARELSARPTRTPC